MLPLAREGRVEVVLGDRAVRLRGLYAVYPSKRLAPRRLTSFVQFLAETFAQRADLVWT